MDIFVCSYSEKRLQYFQKYYNVLNENTTARLHLILDDRYRTRDSYDLTDITIFDKVIWSSDIISFCREFIENKVSYDRICYIYGPAIKMLVFFYLAKKEGIYKSMLLDDDVLFLRPIDDMFQYNFATKKDGLSVIKGAIRESFHLSWPDDLDDLNKDPINSGTMIYTYQEENDLLSDLNLFFDNDAIRYHLEGGYNNRKDDHRITGKIWVAEQFFFSIQYAKIRKRSIYVAEFGSKVKLITVHADEAIPKKMSILPNIMHFLPMDKQRCYDYHTQKVDNFLSKDRV